jgi:hypothetical protein
MDRLAEHLDVVSMPAAAACAAVGLVLLFVTPSRLRLPLSLASMVVTLTLSRLTDIGWASNLAKVLSPLSFVLVAIASYSQPGRRMPLPKYCSLYVMVAVAAIWYVAQTEDRSLAMALRVQWLLLVASALLTARTVVDERSLRRVLLGLFAGGGVACLLTSSAIALAPVQSLQNGFGRFMPYQANPNQIGVLFAVTTALGMYFSLRTHSSSAKLCCIFLTAVAFGQSLLTLSRGSFLVIGLAATPSACVALRRPLFAIFSLGFMAFVLVTVLRYAESSDFERVRNVDDRTSFTLAVLEEVKDRPLWGLATADGLMTYNPDLNAHNAYVEMIYIGGVSLAGPLFALQLWGHWSMARLWFLRRWLPFDPLLISVLAGFSLALLIHGFINDMIYYPTYTWAYLNILVACLAMSLGACATRANTRAIRCQRQRIPLAPTPLRPWTAPPGL